MLLFVFSLAVSAVSRHSPSSFLPAILQRAPTYRLLIPMLLLAAPCCSSWVRLRSGGPRRLLHLVCLFLRRRVARYVISHLLSSRTNRCFTSVCLPASRSFAQKQLTSRACSPAESNILTRCFLAPSFVRVTVFLLNRVLTHGRCRRRSAFRVFMMSRNCGILSRT